jgi:hypothetical protein
VRIFFFKIFWKIIPEIAILSICPKARKKLYIVPAKGKSILEAEAWTAKSCILKSISRPILVIRERKIQEGILVNWLRQIRRLMSRVVRHYPIQSEGL